MAITVEVWMISMLTEMQTVKITPIEQRNKEADSFNLIEESLLHCFKESVLKLMLLLLIKTSNFFFTKCVYI